MLGPLLQAHQQSQAGERRETSAAALPAPPLPPLQQQQQQQDQPLLLQRQQREREQLLLQQLRDAAGQLQQSGMGPEQVHEELLRMLAQQFRAPEEQQLGQTKGVTGQQQQQQQDQQQQQEERPRSAQAFSGDFWREYLNAVSLGIGSTVGVLPADGLEGIGYWQSLVGDAMGEPAPEAAAGDTEVDDGWEAAWPFSPYDLGSVDEDEELPGFLQLALEDCGYDINDV